MNYIKNKQGKLYYTPKNKDKYKGEYPIWCRSNWEYKFCQWCDINDGVISWASEPIPIPYQHPIEIRDARYYPDYLIKCVTKSGKTQTFLVEVKPLKDLKYNSTKNKSKKTILYEQKTYLINKAKIKAAQKYCKLKGWTFKIITEKELFGVR